MWNANAKKPIWSFLALTFIIASVSDGLLILVEQSGVFSEMLSGIAGFIIVTMYRGITAGSAPAWAMYILLKRHNQIRGFKDFFSLIFKTESKSKTVIITAVFFLALFLIRLLTSQYLGDSWFAVLGTLPLLIAGIIGGGMEEPGWRGFFQPALEEKLPFVVATLCVGVIWAVWHIPAWFVQSIGMSSINFLSFTLHCITLSFVMTALYKLTKNVFAVVIFHSWTNALGSVFLSEHLQSAPDFKLIIISTLQIITAIVICTFIDKKKKELTHSV